MSFLGPKIAPKKSFRRFLPPTSFLEPGSTGIRLKRAVPDRTGHSTCSPPVPPPAHPNGLSLSGRLFTKRIMVMFVILLNTSFSSTGSHMSEGTVFTRAGHIQRSDFRIFSFPDTGSFSEYRLPGAKLNENLMIFPFYNVKFYIKMVLRPKSEFVLLKGVCHE